MPVPHSVAVAPASATPESSRRWRASYPLDPARLLALSRGAGDATWARTPDGAVWRACRTPDGPGTVRITALDPHTVGAAAWGPGGNWLLDQLPSSFGDADDPSDFVAHHPAVRTAAGRSPAPLRLPRCENLLEALVPAVLEQRVTGGEARRSWRQLVQRYGTPAPGPVPAGLSVAPTAEQWRRVPSWAWHAAGVDGGRAETILRACRVATRLEEALGDVLSRPRVSALTDDGAAPDDLLTRRLRAIPGVGPWTVAEIRQRACGDPDAVSVGDVHVSKDVGWALVGRPVDDAQMLRLLEPYAGHRYRAVRLLELAGMRRPRFAPRYSPHDFRRS